MREFSPYLEVLVVDDESELREILCEELTRVGFRCAQASGLAEAKQEVDTRPHDGFAVVITDIRMPDGTGLELLKHIRTRHAKSPEVVLITGFADITPLQAQIAGAAHLITKPFDLHRFIQLIQDLAHGQPGSRVSRPPLNKTS